MAQGPDVVESTELTLLANRLMRPGTPAAPTAKSVGASSVLVVAENPTRRGLVLINTHATQWVSFAVAQVSEGTATAVLYSGITLAPNGGVWEMDAETFTTLAIYGIASGASTNVAIQEYS